MKPTLFILTIVLASTLVAIPRETRADDGLAAAKDLYASAAYEDALQMLKRLADSNTGGAVDAGMQVDQYRAFCLFALGRTGEAQAVAVDLIRKHPLLAMQADEMSPRVAAMFADARRQVLPALIREKYQSGKTAVARKDFAAAEPDLRIVVSLIDQARALGIKDDSLGDLGVLADGFLSLVEAATPPPQAEASPQSVTKAASGETAAPVAAAAPARPRTYDANDTDVIAPVLVRQQMPTIPPALVARVGNKRGVLQVAVDIDGKVVGAQMREPIDDAYDSLVLSAVRSWRFKPATRNGAPVRYTTMIGVKTGT